MKKILSLLALLALTCSIYATLTINDGVAMISSKADMLEFASTVNGGQYDLDAMLTTDIDLALTKKDCWVTPIGTAAHPYTGTFNGCGHTLSNFVISTESENALRSIDTIGLFGAIKNATIENLNLVGGAESNLNRNASNVEAAGILCGLMTSSTISRCNVQCNVFCNLSYYAAYICAREENSNPASIIDRCYTSGTFRTRRNNNYSAFVGYAYNVSITNCYSDVIITVDNDYSCRIAGFVAYANATSGRAVKIENCYFNGSLQDLRASSGKTTKETIKMGAFAATYNGANATLVNCHYLTGSAEKAIVENGNSQTAATFETAALTDGTLVEKLGDAFVQGPTCPIINLPVPEITIADAEVALNGSYTPQPVVKVLGVEITADVTYTSSNTNVAKVSNDGKTITLFGTGTTTITTTVAAGSDYLTADTTSTLKVTTFIPEEGKYWEETFAYLELNSSYSSTAKSFNSDSLIFPQWSIRQYKLDQDDKAIKEFRLNSKNTPYLQSTAAMEGGIKYVLFNWHLAGNQETEKKISFSVSALDGDNVLSTYTSAKTGLTDGTIIYPCAVYLDAKQNVKYKLNIEENATDNVSRYSPVKFVPYLLFTVPNHEAKVTVTPTANSYNLGAVLINNTGEPTNYTIVSNTTGSACTITEDVMDLSDVKQSGDIQIKASWNEGKVYTTMTLHVTSTQVTLANAEVALNGSFTPAPVVKLGETVIENANITYASSNTNVAKVSNDGKTIMLFGTGTTTITTTVAQGDTYLGATTTSTLTVNTFTPEQGTYWEETFANMAVSDYENNEKSFDADSLVYPKWKIRQYKLEQKDKAIKEFRLNQKNVPYLKSSEAMEGGIKYVLFYWHLAGNQETEKKISFSVSALDGENVLSTYTSAKTGLTDGTIDYPCAVYLDAKQNVSYKLNIETAETDNVSWYSAVKFVPYLLYTKKNITINAKDYPTKKYTHPNLINNTDVEIETGQKAIVFSIKDESDATKKIATINEETGELNLVGPGTVTVQATWGEVSTTYALTIKSTTLVTLLYDDGTEGKDEFTMNSGDVFPNTLAYPTRENYTFNAYFTQKNGAGKRLTVTGDNQITQWTKNTSMTDNDRKWISLNQKDTLYAHWKAVRTIALDNQSATTAGTEQVKIAYCPNNEDIYLTDITIPEKTGYIFNGYYTQTNGEGVQLVTNAGKWIGKKNDTYVNEKYMWVKDADIILYASWTAKTTTVTMMRNDGTEDSDELTATYGEAFPTKTFTLPTRTGYEFNAYYTSTDCQAEERMTVTSGNNNKTLWLENRTVGDVTYTSGRNWIFLGETLTLYAKWAEQRTITLDNQGATTAGTASVTTANTPNNGIPWLGKKDITCPEKEGFTFLGYFSEKNGEGEQLIGTDGKFIASVSGYTNEDIRWIKDADVTLYAAWKEEVVEITLNEGDNNATTIADNADKLANVALGRTITAGMYNTFCLPFNVDADMMADKFGEDYNLQEFTSATLSGDKQTVTINFTRVNEMEAGKPYLIKTSANVANPSFEEVRMVNTSGTTSGEGIVMKAIINPTHITPGDHSHMIVIANDNMAWLQTGDESTMNGMRAYFEVESNEMKAALRNASPRLVTDDTNTPTNIETPSLSGEGRGEALKMIIKGQLVIVREGVCYDVNGQIVK